jgi:hypothetical protein
MGKVNGGGELRRFKEMADKPVVEVCSRLYRCLVQEELLIE